MHNSFSKTDFYNELQQTFPEVEFLIDEPMKKHTTFRIGGPADIYVEPSISEVVPLITLLREKNVPFMVIGNGSNLLVSDDGIEGVVISFGKNTGQISVDGDIITVQAGAILSSVSSQAVAASLTGFEFASGIPGSMGGAVYMNAGAYGGEIKDILLDVTVLTFDNQVKTIPVEQLDLSYRHSAFMEMDELSIILSARIKLVPGNQDEIKSTIDDIKQKRIEKQPLNFPSAGSTFKRPEGFFAGKLIDDTGLRGYTVGGAQVSEKHCGFVINKSDATAADVLQLMKDVDTKVYDKFGVHLTPEVRIIGRNID
ncbi:UDP-N-acetylmuramate dehydrogenase [Pseudobutyrivibrio sp. ACV-2]|uniref:UDP-N-acetylmuramate dehydrogenase n=1 Tax=Pseudobutyrivibrio sp. ACV-2 TaxID=1520801 RepID=UPI0008984BF9|nr:UDP-N-acetylmuramate dehydrogenase [Pseudobutyrivibrio sp. ACV-2]SEA03208.1 UDP-N-acetylmuramate dehydrogenase [Pseudobutyrivibrio sp. ACV-2]